MAVQLEELGVQITLPSRKEGESGENGKKVFVYFKDIYNARAQLQKTEKGREFLNFLLQELRSIWLMFDDKNEMKLVSDLEGCVARLKEENRQLQMAQPGEQFGNINLQNFDMMDWQSWQSFNFDYSGLGHLDNIQLPPDESHGSSL